MNRPKLLQEYRQMRFKEVYDDWIHRRLNQEEAAQILGVSDRTFRRYLSNYQNQGAEGLLDKRMNQISWRRAPVDEVIALTTLYESRYNAFKIFKQAVRKLYAQNALGGRNSAGEYPLQKGLDLYYAAKEFFSDGKISLHPEIKGDTPYLDADARKKVRLHVKDGCLYDADNKLAYTLAFQAKGKAGVAGYVMDREGDIYIFNHISENTTASELKTYHGAILSGGTVISAGVILLYQGKITSIDITSGHYKPNIANLYQATLLLEKQGVLDDNVTIRFPDNPFYSKDQVISQRSKSCSLNEFKQLYYCY